jgi:hypothetical protein
MASIWQNPYVLDEDYTGRGRGTYGSPYVEGARSGTTEVDRSTPETRQPTSSPIVSLPDPTVEQAFQYDTFNGRQIPAGFNPYGGGNANIVMPDGRRWGSYSADEQSAYLDWLHTGTGPYSGTTSTTSRSSGSNGEGGFDYYTALASIFDDPTGAIYEGYIRNRLGQLSAPVTPESIPGLSEFFATSRARMNDLASPYAVPKEVQDLLNAYAGRANTLARPETNPELERAINYGSSLMAELQAPPFTLQEERAQEVKAYDQLESDRTEAKRQVMERLGARGVGMGSGIVEQALQDVDARFDRLRANRTNDLLLYRTEVGQERKAQAFDVGQAVATMRQAALDRADARADALLNVLGARATTADAIYLREQARATELTNLSAMLADMGLNLFGINEDRAREGVATAALLPEFELNRLITFANTENQSAIPAFGTGAFNLLNAGTNARNTVQASQPNWLQLAGTLAPYIFPQQK